MCASISGRVAQDFRRKLLTLKSVSNRPALWTPGISADSMREISICDTPASVTFSPGNKRDLR
jgi:hypothetical protein